jgi:hypothetical protein
MFDKITVGEMRFENAFSARLDKYFDNIFVKIFKPNEFERILVGLRLIFRCIA